MARQRNTSAQTLIALDLLLEDPEAWHFGYDFSRRSGLKSGTLYPILIRLADQGWLETRWAEPERPGRPARHTYRLTADGRREAAAVLSDAAARRATPRPGTQTAGA